MEYVRLFFSFKGRIPRTIFWGGLGAAIFALALIFFVVDAIRLVFDRTSIVLIIASVRPTSSKAIDPGHFLIFVGMLTLLIFSASLLSLFIRRARDCGVADAWGLLGFLIFAAMILALIAFALTSTFPLSIMTSTGLAAAAILLAATLLPFGCIRGTTGFNRYGSDPREDERLATP